MKTTPGWKAGLLAIAVALTACEGAEVDVTDETAAADSVDHEAALDEFRTSYEAAYNAGDADALMAMYTSDFVEYVPDATLDYAAVEASLRDTVQGMPSGGTLRITTDEWEVAESGDLAHGHGTTVYDGPGPDGATVQMTDRWMAAFKNVDGAWKIHRLAILPMPAVADAAPEDVEEAPADTAATM